LIISTAAREFPVPYDIDHENMANTYSGKIW
jgi:hypothetical protein